MKTNQVQKPKIDNNALFAQRLNDNPPQYNIGDCVKYMFKNNGNQPCYVGYVTVRTFNENEKTWKYTVRSYSMNHNYDDVSILEKHELPCNS